MNTTFRKIGLVEWLFSPFTYIAGGRSLLLGLIAILAAGLLGSFSQTHFDGVLDMHTGRPAPLWFFLSQGFVDWLAMGIVLLVFGKIISRTQFRSLDLLGTQAMARWPTIIIALAAWPDGVRRVGENILNSIRGLPTTSLSLADGIVFAVSVLAGLLMTCWFVLLAYRSYSISCNVKGGRAIGTFMAGLLIAEILSKLGIAVLFLAVRG